MFSALLGAALAAPFKPFGTTGKMKTNTKAEPQSPSKINVLQGLKNNLLSQKQ
jgi:hypothetical protein